MRRRDLLRSMALSPLVISIPSKGKEGIEWLSRFNRT